MLFSLMGCGIGAFGGSSAGSEGGGIEEDFAATEAAWGGTVRTVTATGDITTALQNAIDASVSGDVVSITAGTCSMGTVVWHNKNIWIHGAGKAETVITANNGFGQIFADGSAVPASRLSHFTLTSTAAGFIGLTIWAMDEAVWKGGWRIDHINWNYPNNGAAIYAFGPQWGLVDHCDFPGAFEAMILSGLFTLDEFNNPAMPNLRGAFGASLAYQPGDPRYLYIEDCTFTGTDDGQVFSCIDTAYHGGRFVFRHNTVTDGMLYAHWTSGNNVNSLWWEIYDNSFTMAGGLAPYPFRMQGGGSGLIYNNSFAGYGSPNFHAGDGRLPEENQSGAPLLLCDGTRTWDGNAGDATAVGWPALMQIGRNGGKTIAAIIAGDKQTSFPLYLWGNTGQGLGLEHQSGDAADFIRATPHAVAGAGYGQGDVDYSITSTQPAGAGNHTLTYTPFTYPYPLTAKGLPNPP